ncbi:MAG: S8 family serine peptidase [Candidatus Edwardsbacteria bacterium]|nr:S8 family serine peptidase [Candidatus Edwardsbacteria bacterium]MBU1576120.1 S8 family serine peptidase [Candidatus Edwardsbacteria bacterium]MBU2464018.1 S8 family serine peptidase [Candidatus Edwardsbacteria bacterium]MBU2593161.1 S8 family serine peptidase [Candidatus Edwardsbacteria bacterium]
MNAFFKIVFWAGATFWLFLSSVTAQPPITGRLASALEKTKADTTIVVLVFFYDKGFSTKDELRSALDRRGLQLSPRALKRRAKMGRQEMTFEDLPVNTDYVHRIESLGAKHRQSLTWFNAASFEMTGSQVKTCQNLSFVKTIDLLPARRKRIMPELETISPKMPDTESPKAHLLNYGPSFTQDSLINAVICHDSGYSGAGVLVAMLDNGFRKGHQAFDSIRSSGRLVDEWDFCSSADTVDWDAHGTAIWSAAGGYVPGQLIGPAYKSLWAIYHTEDMSQEMPVEEDHWVAALQRADSVGAEVVSSSLAYRDFDLPQYSYSYEDLDGNTAISSLAARHAASLGIIVCNAMANSGPSLGTLAAPADADSIISVGATDSFGIIASYSSRGPTYDGRPKPEVCAQGTQVYLASWTTTTSYGRGSGTSCSTPLVAGACALILEAHPDWTPMQVREALMMTASRSTSPDSNTYGWGIIDTWAAIHYSASGATGENPQPRVGPGLALSCRPNPMRSEAVISFTMPRPGSAKLSVYDITGRLVYQSPTINAAPGNNQFSWYGRDYSGRLLGNGVYFCRVNGGGQAGIIKITIIR